MTNLLRQTGALVEHLQDAVVDRVDAIPKLLQRLAHAAGR
jgi:hypothetical protein